MIQLSFYCTIFTIKCDFGRHFNTISLMYILLFKNMPHVSHFFIMLIIGPFPRVGHPWPCCRGCCGGTFFLPFSGLRWWWRLQRYQRRRSGEREEDQGKGLLQLIRWFEELLWMWSPRFRRFRFRLIRLWFFLKLVVLQGLWQELIGIFWLRNRSESLPLDRRKKPSIALLIISLLPIRDSLEFLNCWGLAWFLRFFSKRGFFWPVLVGFCFSYRFFLAFLLFLPWVSFAWFFG